MTGHPAGPCSSYSSNRAQPWIGIRCLKGSRRRIFRASVTFIRRFIAHEAYRNRPRRMVGELPNTWHCSRTALSLPLYSDMTDYEQERVCKAIEALLAER